MSPLICKILLLILCICNLICFSFAATTLNTFTLSGFNVSYITAPSGSAADGFGTAVALDTTDGSRLIVGAPQEGIGAVYVYRWSQSGLSWEFEQRLVLEDATLISETVNFGIDVAIDQNTIVIFSHNIFRSNHRYFVFKYENNEWVYHFKSWDALACPNSLPYISTYREGVFMGGCALDSQTKNILYAGVLDPANPGGTYNSSQDPNFPYDSQIGPFCSVSARQGFLAAGAPGKYYTFFNVPASGVPVHTYNTFSFSPASSQCVISASGDDSTIVVAAQDQPDNVQFRSTIPANTLLGTLDFSTAADAIRTIAVGGNTMIIAGSKSGTGVAGAVNTLTRTLKWTVEPPSDMASPVFAGIAARGSSYVFGVTSASAPARVYFALNESVAAAELYGLPVTTTSAATTSASSSTVTSTTAAATTVTSTTSSSTVTTMATTTTTTSTNNPNVCLSDVSALLAIIKECHNGAWEIRSNDSAPITNNATIVVSPGNSGAVVIEGDFINKDSGVIVVRINDTKSNNPIVVDGKVVLGGTLVLELKFIPSPDEPIQIVAASSIEGRFSNVTVIYTGERRNRPCGIDHTEEYGLLSMSVIASPRRCSSNKQAIIIGTATSVAFVVLIIISVAIFVVVYIAKNGSQSWKRLLRGPVKSTSNPDVPRSRKTTTMTTLVTPSRAHANTTSGNLYSSQGSVGSV